MYLGPIGSITNMYPAVGSNAIGQPVNTVNNVNGVVPVDQKSSPSLRKVSPSDCPTCKSRKYMDVSDESNVSFQSPTHVSPQGSYAAVASHEQEHVSNAISNGNKQGNSLISVSVTLKMAVCLDCGTPYVAGGVTHTTMKYDTSNPYEKSRKSVEGSLLKGMNVDFVA